MFPLAKPANGVKLLLSDSFIHLFKPNTKIKTVDCNANRNNIMNGKTGVIGDRDCA